MSEQDVPSSRSEVFVRSAGAARTKSLSAALRRPRAARTPGPTGPAAHIASTETADLVAQHLAGALPTLKEEVRSALPEVRPRSLRDDDQWAQVRDLVLLGVAAAQPATALSAQQLAWALGKHALFHLVAGTSRTVSGWYSPDAIETTLSSTALSARASAAFAARFRRISATLLPAPRPGPRTFEAFDPAGPYTTGELDRLLDHVDGDAHRRIRTRVLLLIWLGLGAGPWPFETPGLTGSDVSYGTSTLMVRLPGGGKNVPARSVPVLGAGELPLAALVTEVGDSTLWPGLKLNRRLPRNIVHAANLPETLPSLSVFRLRATWLAMLLGAGASLTAVLPVAGVQGELSFGHLAAQVLPPTEDERQQLLRAANGPLPTFGQLLLPGHRYPTPHVATARRRSGPAMSVATVGEADVVVRLPVRPTYSAVRSAARRAPLVGVDKVNVVKVPAGLVRLAEATLDRGPLVGYVESLLPQQDSRPTGGRVRVLNVRAALFALLLLGLAEQAMILRDGVALLNGLHPSTKHRLGIPRRDRHTGAGGVTERMLSRLFNQITSAVDPSPHTPLNDAARRAAHQEIRDSYPGEDNRDGRRTLHQQAEADHAKLLQERLEGLRFVLDSGLEATLPDTQHTGSYAIDGSEVHSWAHQYHRQPKAPALISDPDARWKGKGKGWSGYWLHGVVRAGEVGGPDVPCLTERIELTAANFDSRTAGLRLLERMVASHEVADEQADRAHRPRRTVLADRADTSVRYRPSVGITATQRLAPERAPGGIRTHTVGGLSTVRLPVARRGPSAPSVRGRRGGAR